MIKELEMVEYEECINFETNRRSAIVRPPNNKEIMDKINEIIMYINYKEDSFNE